MASISPIASWYSCSVTTGVVVAGFRGCTRTWACVPGEVVKVAVISEIAKSPGADLGFSSVAVVAAAGKIPLVSGGYRAGG